MQTSADVIIIGLGPTGAVLAHLLGQAGINTVVFEREAEVYPRPRAVFFDDEICRLLWQLGLGDALATFSRPVQGMDLVNGAGDVLYRYRPGTAESELGFAEGYMFSQPDLERALRRALASHSSVTQLTGFDVEGVRRIDRGPDSPPDYEVLALDLNGNRQTCRAPWVIGCDGASSPTRRLIGADLEELGPDAEWLVVDLQLEPGVPAWLDLPEVTVQYCDPARPATFVPLPQDRCRFEIRVLPDDDRNQLVRLEPLRALLRTWLPSDDYEVERAVVYTFHALLAERWRDGGLLLAGDAAHQMPPFLGQGMCSGIRDAANLAWKLAWVLRGRASLELLDTYESERSAHTRRIIEVDLELGDLIQTTDPQLAAVRDERARAEGGAVPISPPRIPIGPGAHTGEAPSGLPVPAFAAAPVTAAPCAAEHAAEAPFATASSVEAGPAVDELLLIHAPDFVPNLVALRTPGMATRSTDPALQSWLDGFAAQGVLVRPDGLVAGLLQTSTDLERVFSMVAPTATADPAAPAAQGLKPEPHDD